VASEALDEELRMLEFKLARARGMTSLGHASYLGVAAYISALLTSKYGFGHGAAAKKIRKQALAAANAEACVLLTGESGTGKNILARAIHNWSERKDGPFVAINCVGLSKELLESELFGHEKGAFTGAHQLKKGKVELAHGGTVFLDELGDILSEVQAKLLRFLQEREFERVGGTKSIRVDVRIVAATNRDIAAYVQDGRFREDLYHRLNVIPIRLPPLRERKEDIADLSQFFLKRFSLDAKKNFTEITNEALEKLTGYNWPGNVRELANVIEHAVVLGSDCFPQYQWARGPPRAVLPAPGRLAVLRSQRGRWATLRVPRLEV